MADFTDILAGAFGGAANPNDPFSYAKLQLARKQEADAAGVDALRTQIMQGELDLRRQLQPYSIASLQADIKRNESAAKEADAQAARIEQATAEAKNQYEQFGKPLFDYLGSAIKAHLNGEPAPDAAKAAVAMAQPQGPMFDESGPAALLGLPLPDRDPLTALLSKRAHAQTVAKILGSPITPNSEVDAFREMARRTLAAQAAARNPQQSLASNVALGGSVGLGLAGAGGIASGLGALFSAPGAPSLASQMLAEAGQFAIPEAAAASDAALGLTLGRLGGFLGGAGVAAGSLPLAAWVFDPAPHSEAERLHREMMAEVYKYGK